MAEKHNFLLIRENSRLSKMSTISQVSFFYIYILYQFLNYEINYKFRIVKYVHGRCQTNMYIRCEFESRSWQGVLNTM